MVCSYSSGRQLCHGVKRYHSFRVIKLAAVQFYLASSHLLLPFKITCSKHVATCYVHKARTKKNKELLTTLTYVRFR